MDGEADWMDVLFPGNRNVSMADVRAGLEQMAEQERARRAAVVAAEAAMAAAPRCTRCGGTGQLPQFLHRNGGACYGCDGTGKRSAT